MNTATEIKPALDSTTTPCSTVQSSPHLAEVLQQDSKSDLQQIQQQQQQLLQNCIASGSEDSNEKPSRSRLVGPDSVVQSSPFVSVIDVIYIKDQLCFSVSLGFIIMLTISPSFFSVINAKGKSMFLLVPRRYTNVFDESKINRIR